MHCNNRIQDTCLSSPLAYNKKKNAHNICACSKHQNIMQRLLSMILTNRIVAAGDKKALL